MNNKFNNPWNMNITDFQNQFLNSFNSFQPSSAFDNPFNQNPFARSMDSWWKTNSHSLPTDQFDLLNKIMTQGKSLYFLGDQLIHVLETLSTQKQAKDNWQHTLEQQIDMMKEAFMNQTNQFDQSFTSELFTAQAALQSMLNTLPGFTDINNTNISESDINEYLEKYLSMPGLGLNRELQEKLQRTLLSFKQYQENTDKYKSAMMEVAVNAMDLLKSKLIAQAKNDEKIESLRQIYDLWVDCNEECYGEYTLTEEYSVLYGNLVNSMMVYKKNHSEVMDDMYSVYNVPSKKEFDDLIKEQYQLKHQLKKATAEKTQEQSKYDELKQELDELKSIVKKTKTKRPTKGTVKKKKTKTKSAAKRKESVSKKK